MRQQNTYAYFGAPQEDQEEDECIKTADDREAHDDPERYENDHPAPGDEAIQSQCDEDELNDVHRTEELQLKISIVLHGPKADRNRKQRNKDKRYERQHPDMSSGFELSGKKGELGLDQESDCTRNSPYRS